MTRQAHTDDSRDRTGPTRCRTALGWLCVVVLAGISRPAGAVDQGTINLTLDTAVATAMSGSYRIRQLEMGIERYRKLLDARQAGLKSSVSLDLTSPEIEAVAETKWNSTLQRDEIVHSNTRLWQMELAVRQPVILLGFPTNGYLSLNNKMYRYSQQENGDTVTNYYNRYFVKFTQPFFSPNSLKNDLENAELDLERGELNFLVDQVNLYGSTAYIHFRLFDLAYTETIHNRRLDKLTIIAAIADSLAAADSTRIIEGMQAHVELNNTRESILGTQSSYRLSAADARQRLRLPEGMAITVDPDIVIPSIDIDLDLAISRGFEYLPTLKLHDIERRKNEISLDETKGRNSFDMELEMTYGVEKMDEDYENLWSGSDNSYSTTLNAYVPLWDWGRRKISVAAEKISIDRTDLNIEESQGDIPTQISIAVANLKEFQSRTMLMSENLAKSSSLTDMSIDQYRTGDMKLTDLLQNLNRETETDENFLDAYMGYRRALVQLSQETYYDYADNIPLMEKLYSLKASQDEKD